MRCTTRSMPSSLQPGRARDLCQDLNATRERRSRTARILRELFGNGGDSVWMQPPFYCDYGTNIELGERVFFNFNCVVLDVCQVRIGDFTMFGPAVQIYTAMHPMNAGNGASRSSASRSKSDPTCGSAAERSFSRRDDRLANRDRRGQRRHRDVPDGVFAAGNPCRVIRTITE